MEIRSARDFTVEQVAECSNEAFADYFGHPIRMTPQELDAYMPSHCISKERSLVACPEGSNAPIGFALMAYRDDLPGHARLAGMGVVPSWAGKGVGSKLLAAVMDNARADGTKTIWLEVISINTPGIKLYSRNGFKVVRALSGWAKPADPATTEQTVQLEESTPEEVLRLTKKYGAAADLPWQLWHQFSLSLNPQNSRAFKLGQAYCAISNPDDASKDTVSLHAVVVEPEARRQGQATALLRAVLAKFPGKKWKAPATIPQEYGETIAKRLGVSPDDLTMDLMRLDIE